MKDTAYNITDDAFNNELGEAAPEYLVNCIPGR